MTDSKKKTVKVKLERVRSTEAKSQKMAVGSRQIISEARVRSVKAKSQTMKSKERKSK